MVPTWPLTVRGDFLFHDLHSLGAVDDSIAINDHGVLGSGDGGCGQAKDHGSSQEQCKKSLFVHAFSFSIEIPTNELCLTAEKYPHL